MRHLQTNAFCACCSGLLHRPLGRRALLRGGGAAAAILAAGPRLARAASGKYEAMILTCIDPRVQEPVHAYAEKRKLTGQYSQFIVAGAAIGVVAPAFAKWHETFWDNLKVSVDLHGIESVIAIDHRDCGAAKIAYGAEKVANADIETATHRAAMMEFRTQVGARHPTLKVEAMLMALDGSVTTFT
ncbi:MAG TPA: carbonic anhydrase [Stellaceae bacterium]|nr:carbonic anhydrase [Stellaceae bacterium]